MRIIRISAVFAWVLLASVAGSDVTSAQGRSQSPPARPAAGTPAGEPAVPAAFAQSDQSSPRLFRYRRPIVRVAQDYTLPAGEVAREVQTVFGNVTIEGRVEDDVVVIMGSARLASTAVVEGSFAVFGGSATIDPGASIGRDLVVIGGTLTAPTAFSPDGHHVVIGTPWLGDTLQDVVPWITRGLLWGRLIVPDLNWVWAFVGIFVLIYLALNTVFERPVRACADALSGRPLSTFVAGLLVLLLTIPVIAIVAASVIGLALVPFILCALIVAALIGKAGVARAIGRSVLRSESPEGRTASTAALMIGLALLTLAYTVPVLGFVTWALTTVVGLGAATITFRAMLRRERPVPLAAPVAATAAPSAAAAMPAVPIGEPYDAPRTPQAPAIPMEPPAPPPVYSSGLAQYPRATFLDRVAAFALDAILVAIAVAVLDMDRYDGFFLLTLLAYHIAFWAWRGTTLGGIICNLRVIRTHGAELRFADAMVRGLTSIFSLAALGIGCFWMLQDPEKQMWHDKIAGTLVVKVPRDLVLP